MAEGILFFLGVRGPGPLVLYEAEFALMIQKDSLDLFLDVHGHQWQAKQPELGEQHHLDPQETVY